MTTLWLTNRSAYQRQHGQCSHARYLEYNSAANGYGMRLKAESVYLPTGIFFHKILQGFLEIAVEAGWKTFEFEKHRADARKVIHDQVERYQRLIDARGLRNVDSLEQTQTIMEQATLIEGLGWAWGTCLLPYLQEHFTPLSIEQEETVVLGCTCGLPAGVGSPEDHETRGCEGIVWCSRADFLTSRDADETVGWQEFKTGAQVFRTSFRERWEQNVQFASGILGAERRLGREVSHFYIHGLQKGSRKSQYVVEEKNYSGPRRQDSILCYSYMVPADPPTRPHEDWQPRFQWTEYDPDTGGKKTRRLPRPPWKNPPSPGRNWLKSALK